MTRVWVNRGNQPGFNERCLPPQAQPKNNRWSLGPRSALATVISWEGTPSPATERTLCYGRGLPHPFYKPPQEPSFALGKTEKRMLPSSRRSPLSLRGYPSPHVLLVYFELSDSDRSKVNLKIATWNMNNLHWTAKPLNDLAGEHRRGVSRGKDDKDAFETARSGMKSNPSGDRHGAQWRETSLRVLQNAQRLASHNYCFETCCRSPLSSWYHISEPISGVFCSRYLTFSAWE